ncbi:ileal sodium/bile acid cotransporter-like [Anneissia japonica]|uniref:ileal sodium/bile acid cotransporter-like n=1 Tax=Anneissia japonica TaxID=1529436 RepID=UPI001425AC75|nr:ileal sodium/bile acid cotransporter-like [Anneissia japonica]
MANMPTCFISMLFYMLVLLAFAHVHAEFNYTFDTGDDNSYFLLEEDEVRILNLTITVSEDITLSFTSSDESAFNVLNGKEYVYAADSPVTVQIEIQGVFVSVEKLRIEITQGVEDYTIPDFTIKVLRPYSVLSDIFTYALLLWLLISYVTMGTKMDFSIIKTKFKPPTGITIGLICQFFLMPLLAYGLANAFKLSNESSVGLILDGTCPGGWLSNIFSLLLDCDFVLSLTMTFSSTILALGMMPLNLFIYTRTFTDDNDDLKTPFFELAQQLLILVIPVGIGIIILYKFPKATEICEKLLKPFATFLIVIALGLGIPAEFYVFLSPWEIWMSSALFPLIGSILGLTFALIGRLDRQSAVTVALEVGVQNSLLAKTMVDLAYPEPESDLIARIPLLIALLTLIEGTIITAVYILVKRLCHKEEDEADLVKDKKDVELTNGNKTGEPKTDIEAGAQSNPGFTPEANM